MAVTTGGTPYTSEYYSNREAAADASARRVARIVMDLVRPASVVDLGCATGTWLRAFIDLGVERARGVDGPFVNREDLLFDPELFTVHDLGEPIELERHDLAISLEVAEHLPAGRADGFVADLVRAAPSVLFSAAIPGQGGARHVNEQWPEYWVERFAARGFEPVDCIRPRIWDAEDVEPWYAMNVLLFVDPAERWRWPELPDAPPTMLGAVHPELWRRACDRRPRLRSVLAGLPTTALQEVGRLRARRHRAFGTIFGKNPEPPAAPTSAIRREGARS
jgi:hypothetical protein